MYNTSQGEREEVNKVVIIKKEHLYHTKKTVVTLMFFYRKFFMSDATSAKHSAPFFIKNSLLLNPHKTEMHRTFAALAVAMSTSESPT